MSEHLSERQLNEYAEGLLADVERRRAADHLADCAACREAVTQIRSLREGARRMAPPSFSTGRDLWPAIEARIRENPVRAGGGGEAVERGEIRARSETPRTGMRGAWRRPALLAAAALVLVSLSSALTLMIAREGSPPAPGTTPERIAAAGEEDADVAFLTVSREVSEAYEPTIQDLRQVLEENRDRLDPETVQVVEESLRIIEEAIEEAVAALAADPASSTANRTLRSMYDAKLQLLQQAAALARSA
jgi:hypothetical protein